MYLKAKKYVFGWQRRDEAETDEVKQHGRLLEALGLTNEDVKYESIKSITIKVGVAYWRKANQIHRWFVENVQNGLDDCEPNEVSREQLQTLLDECKAALESKSSDNLPPKSGFFFGSTEVDEWYWQGIKETVEQLEFVLNNPKFKDWTFEYTSSW